LIGYTGAIDIVTLGSDEVDANKQVTLRIN